GIGAAGDDQIAAAPPRERAYAAAAQVEQFRSAEAWLLAAQDCIRVFQREDECFALWDWAAQAEQQLAIGSSGHAFDVEAPLVWGTARSAIDPESRQARVGAHGLDQSAVRRADKCPRALARGELGSEEPEPCWVSFATLGERMRG